ncbi:MAG: hypothetical protein H0V67_09645 [Geodermatophilaceae bacterium]|nr:hypothetical protein [Geodermatophilaceae bacterium]
MRFAAGAGIIGGSGLLSACTGSPGPVTPTSASAPVEPDPLLAVLDERVGLIGQYDAAGLRHPELHPRLLPLRMQTKEQVVALRLALALPEPTVEPTASAAAESSTTAGTSGSSSAVPVDPAVSLEAIRLAVQASGGTAAALCETTSAERAPLVGSLAAAAACHELLLR